MLEHKILIDEDTLNKRIEELANQISKDYNGEDIVLVCTLKGAVYFTIDLSKKITGSDVILDFVRVSSYGVNNRYTEYSETLEKNLGIPKDELLPLIFIFVNATFHYSVFEDDFYLKVQLQLVKMAMAQLSEKYLKK